MELPSDKSQQPTSHSRILRTAGVCDAWFRERRMYDRVLPTAFLIGVLGYLLYMVTLAAPLSFPGSSYLKVGKGATLDQVAEQLEARHFIRSATVFKKVAYLYRSSAQVTPGEYFFPGPESVFTVARRIMRGDHELSPVKVTIPEGANTREIGAIIAQKIHDFDEDTFLEEAQPEEGYLFPDTYFFLPGADPETVLSAMQTNFKQKMDQPQVQSAFQAFGKPLSDIITMASLIEKEAPKSQDRRIIAGILWKRLALGMPLQVDAVFPYIIGKNSFQLTHADLKTDSPYNTYTNKGLPPGPITNPGLDAIMAAMTPIKTNYLYYLSDMQGNFHYSATYAAQLANQRKYLNN